MEGEILRIAAYLSTVGGLVVAAVLCAAALGKTKKGFAYRIMVRFSLLGTALPFVIYLWIYLQRHFGFRFETATEDVVLVLWPSSIALMAINSNNFAALLFVGVLILMNAGLYGIIGLCIGFVWEKSASS
jgi:hypothetical protein